MGQLTERKHSFQGTEVYYYTTGNPDGEAIVLLHAAYSDHHIFREQFGALGSQYFLIAIDMLGHGSTRAEKSNLDFSHMPEIIHHILSENKVAKAHLLGVSLGSLVAQAAACQYPSIVRSVCIVGGYSIHKDNKDILRKQRKEMLRSLIYIIFSMEKFKSYVVETAVHSENGKEAFREGIRHFTRQSFKAMGGMGKLFRPAVEPAEYPLLIVCGAYDLELIRTAGQRLQRLEPKSQYAEISGAGHCANIDNPAAFNQVYLEFIRSLSLDPS
ncbi:alpha/beta hydrolase [Paenibacillus sp. PK3_47]|uniref:alpha/beta fold hydrolase n=1 Tax=Paenibacillus sp. PK3_47 TaxID=2072642 RepID=UPI00201E4FEA|nr:alpha/beta hydrolase [Paenibacillus sp. PK3_47]UQZ34084.1 alpha/beta hydrolase [Paenibacillus sp. PK3_47]